MTFEDEKMERAMESLKQTEKLCDVDNLFEGVFTRRPSDKCTVEERLERMIIWADCELFMAFLMFLKQSKDYASLSFITIPLTKVTKFDWLFSVHSEPYSYFTLLLEVPEYHQPTTKCQRYQHFLMFFAI